MDLEAAPDRGSVFGIGLTNYLKRQENAYRLSFPSDRLIILYNLFALFTAYCTLRNETTAKPLRNETTAKRNHCETRFQTQFYINDSYNFLLTNM